MTIRARHDRLRRRAAMLARLRQFFAERRFLEVETPLLDDEIIPEPYIEPFVVPRQSRGLSWKPPAQPGNDGRADHLWLQASPEMHMKRLLAEGLPAIYQVTRSFRRGERGAFHNPEFTIIEWYRAGDRTAEGFALLDELCQDVAGAPPAEQTTYEDAFRRHVGVDPHCAACAELAAAAGRLGVAVPEALDRNDRDEWLNLLMAMRVEPQLGAERPEVLCEYPASQSALAATVVRPDGVEVAERFELYWRGVELANGYYELTAAAALRARLEAVNRRRAADGRPALPLPERLLAAMESPGLPSCTGCALGFDRLFMLTCGAATIDEVMTYPAE
jgi:lysyl-tRNA synthetase class 2